MSSGEINAAFYCSHIAKHTVETNEHVMIYGPAVMNAEVICYKDDWEKVKTVGVGQGREQEKSLAGKAYPQIETFQDISQKGILYALEDGQVDAVILDVENAAQVPDYACRPLSENDSISYVLVADKDFAKTEVFMDFIESYNKAAIKLNKPAYLSKKLGVEESWLDDKGIRFLTLEESEE